MSIDARKDPRVEVRLSAEVEMDGRVHTAITRNLSVGGVCLEAHLEVADGAELKIGLFLVEDDVEDATREPLAMRGKVAWSAPGEQEGAPSTIGIRFESVSAAQMAGLTRFLKLVPA